MCTGKLFHFHAYLWLVIGSSLKRKGVRLTRHIFDRAFYKNIIRRFVTKLDHACCNQIMNCRFVFSNHFNILQVSCRYNGPWDGWQCHGNIIGLGLLQNKVSCRASARPERQNCPRGRSRVGNAGDIPCWRAVRKVVQLRVVDRKFTGPKAFFHHENVRVNIGVILMVESDDNVTRLNPVAVYTGVENQRTVRLVHGLILALYRCDFCHVYARCVPVLEIDGIIERHAFDRRR